MYHSIIETSFFQHIHAPEDIRLIEKAATLQAYKKGSVLFHEGDPGKELFIVKSGSLKIFREHDGQQLILGHQFPGEAIGELEIFHYDNSRNASVAAIEHTEVWALPDSFVVELAEKYPAIFRKTIYILSERLAQADRQLEYLAFGDVQVRLANLLLDLDTNFGESTADGRLINWKITQQHAANMIGSSRETISRAFQQLQEEKIIRFENRYTTILNMEKLRNLSNTSHKPAAFQNRAWHSTDKYD